VSQMCQSSSYRVRRGDHLFKIARLCGKNYRDLARTNHLSKPYIIRPGQLIVLNKQRARALKPFKKTIQKTSRIVGKHHKQGRRPVVRKARQEKGISSGTAVKSSVRKSSLAQRRTVKRIVSSVSWQWPVRGKLLKPFRSKKGKKGIEIAGRLGQVVSASAAGKVVYSGSGLVGYGKLLIIKHGREYLTAYAHNNKLHVREGDKVRAGQHIADMGRTGTTVEKLHFEIRKNGKPVNPLHYLPKQSL